MAGALSLQDDILALVKKHSDTCLPQDLLARLSEEARLLGVREHIRSLHEADAFGLFSDRREEEQEEEDGVKPKAGGAAVLPGTVLRVLETMKINRLDKVATLNGFTTIDAEVEFSRARKYAEVDPTAPSPASQDVRDAPPLSDAAAAAAEAGAAAGARAATTVERKQAEPGGSLEEEEEEEEEDEESPVFLTFRFRRERLLRGDADAQEGSKDAPDGGANVYPKVAGGGGGGSGREVIDLATDDDDEEAQVVASPSKSDGGTGGRDGGSVGSSSEKENSVVIAATAAPGKDSASNGGSRGGGKGRKRAGSRGTDGEGGSGGDKCRKRPKGHDIDDDDDDDDESDEEDGDREDEEQEEEVEVSFGIFKPGDGSDDESDGDGLDYEPRTLVSYSISGGIGYRPAESLLQAVVYARGDGPACVMPPPERRKDKDNGGGDDDADDDDDDDDDAEGDTGTGSVSNDQEDVFDCNVCGPALAALGRALGLHTEDPAPSSSNLDSDPDSDFDSGSDSPDRAGCSRKNDETKRPPQSEKGADVELGPAEGRPGEGSWSMTLSDLVWWLLLFPFFEKEFDIVEVVASSVFGDDDSPDSDDGDGGGQGNDSEA